MVSTTGNVFDIHCVPVVETTGYVLIYDGKSLWNYLRRFLLRRNDKLFVEIRIKQKKSQSLINSKHCDFTFFKNIFAPDSYRDYVNLSALCGKKQKNKSVLNQKSHPQKWKAFHWSNY